MIYKIKSRKKTICSQPQKTATVRLNENLRATTLLESSWDSFFTGTTTATDDFMTERASQTQAEREALE